MESTLTFNDADMDRLEDWMQTAADAHFERPEDEQEEERLEDLMQTLADSKTNG